MTSKKSPIKHLIFGIILVFCLCYITAQDTNIDKAFDALFSNDYVTAKKLFESEAANGDLDALNGLGYLYERGFGTEQNYEKAFQYYFEAAIKGHANAQSNLALAYEYGRGCKADMESAINWFTKAAEGGYAQAQANLGDIYCDREDYEKALYYYELAAEQEDPGSICNIGYLYANGYGVEQNYDIAFDYYLKSAELGISTAQSNVGAFFEQGKGCTKNLTKAVEWYQKAAAQGDDYAIYRLRQMAEE